MVETETRQAKHEIEPVSRSQGADRLLFADLFAGIGGIRLAFERAGGRCVFTSEWDRHSARTYLENFGDEPQGDIAAIPAEEVPDHDILLAGFPCQPFSLSGVSKLNSLGQDHGFMHMTQGTLFFELARIIEEKQPRAFLLENVKNLLGHDKGRTFTLIKRTLEEDLGYDLHFRILDARTLVPQHRERIYIVGFREPVNFEFPDLPDLSPRLADILQDQVEDRYTLSDHLWQYLRDYAEKHRSKGNGFGYGLADLQGVTRTLSARYHKDGSEILIPQEGKNPRRLTPRECARLMGFPDDFRIVVSDTQAYRQFGNSVVVPVVEHVAAEMVDCLTDETRKTERRRKPALQQTLPL